MNSPAVVSRRPVASRTTSVAPSAVCDPTSGGTHAAANDDAKAAFENFFKDPLWMIAIAMGIFFGVAALILALG